MKKISVILAAMGLAVMATAQETKTIGTETVTVVKPYSPSITEAFKIKTEPQLNDSIALKKKPVTYGIFSVPVASTFTPAKGKAAQVERTPPPIQYNSYASVGLGNFSNALVKFYTNRTYNRGEDLLDVALDHFSSRGDIESTPLDTDFYDTQLETSYTKKKRDLQWGGAIELQHRLNNWYGLQSGVFTQTQVDAVDEMQNYLMGGAKMDIQLEDSFFTDANLVLRRFQDDFDSAENRAILTTGFEFPISNEQITLTAQFDYLSGEFQNSSLNEITNSGAFAYGFFQAGLSPSLLVLRDELTLNLGANFVYGMDIENSNGNLYIYPSVTASYRLVDDTVIAYGGLIGDLRQNSYYDLSLENPFVSPTLAIQPTDVQYDGHIGIKGQLLTKIGYNLKGAYKAENRLPLFFLNPQNLFRGEEGYAYGNSFQVFYDDVRTFGLQAEISVDINGNFTLGLNGQVNEYRTETDNPAWNLPKVQGSLFLDYQLGDHWSFGGNLFYVGQREDLRSIAAANLAPNEFASEILTLDAYFDANIHLGYRFDDQLSIFAKFNNLADNYYERWASFRVQGFQVMAGLSYKFDF